MTRRTRTTNTDPTSAQSAKSDRAARATSAHAGGPGADPAFRPRSTFSTGASPVGRQQVAASSTTPGAQAASPAGLPPAAVEALGRTSLFRGVTADQAQAMASCLQARVVEFRRGQALVRAGDVVREMGVVVAGAAHVVRSGYWGDENLVEVVGPGGVFGENLACMGDVPSDVEVRAAKDGQAVFLNAHKVAHTCSSMCPFHQRVLDNLLFEVARKNLALTQKMSVVTQRSTRRKVLAYLSSMAQAKGSATFSIPLNRQEMADYLAVDRSALSSVLGRLSADGVISFEKNDFTLKRPVDE